MAAPTHQEPLLESDQFLPGVSPPPYEMSGSYSNPYAPSQLPAYVSHEPKTLPSAPTEFYSRPVMPNNSASANFPMPSNGHPMGNTAPGVNYAMPAPHAAYPGSTLGNTTTAVNFAMPAGAIPVGPKSMQMRCFHCQAFINTKTVSSAKSSAHFACCLLFFLSCGICSCIPYCMGSCRRVDHFCPNCSSFLGSYNS